MGNKILASAVEGGSETGRWLAGGMVMRRRGKLVTGTHRNKITLGKYAITLFGCLVCLWKWVWKRLHLVSYCEVV